jgi:hypothetical protein
MEVHHHPNVEKKNFKEYFLEFLMIFLAVTMGFFAENFREHLADRIKEKYLIHLLKEDLTKDTAHLHLLIYERIPLVNKFMDSATRQITSLPIRENEKKLIAAIENGTVYFDFTPSEIALSEFKYAGRVDLVENPGVKDAIFNYASQVNFYNAYTSGMHQAEWALDTALASVFSIHDNNRLLLKIDSSVTGWVTAGDIPDDIHFATNAPGEFKRLSVKINQLNALVNDELIVWKRLYVQATTLLEVLNKEYPDIPV